MTQLRMAGAVDFGLLGDLIVVVFLLLIVLPVIWAAWMTVPYIFRLPPQTNDKKLVVGLALLALIIGFISGIIAYIYNDGQIGYLFAYPVCVTLGLEILVGALARYAVRQYARQLNENYTENVVQPKNNSMVD